MWPSEMGSVRTVFGSVLGLLCLKNMELLLIPGFFFLLAGCKIIARLSREIFVYPLDMFFLIGVHLSLLLRLLESTAYVVW